MTLPAAAPAQGTILPGVTRKSVIELARFHGYTVEEGDCPVAEAMEADEIFTCGTAVVVQSVGSLTYQVPALRCFQLPDDDHGVHWPAWSKEMWAV